MGTIMRKFALLSTTLLACSVALTNALYDVDGVGSFTEFRTYTFDGSVDNFSGQDNLFMSDYSQDDMSDSALATHNHNYDPANIYVDAPYVYLRVRGQDMSDASNISCAEMTTDESRILYASVRTTAIFSSEPGTVHGLFFYEANTQEIDMEYVSNITAQQNEPVNTGQSSLGSIPPLQLTNQATDGKSDDATYSTVLLPSDATTVEHEYRIDWLESLAEFYIDGSLVQTYTDNVPTVPGTWIWNNWANGDPGFSTGPPTEDSFLKIRKIVMYYNTSTST